MVKQPEGLSDLLYGMRDRLPRAYRMVLRRDGAALAGKIAQSLTLRERGSRGISHTELCTLIDAISTSMHTVRLAPALEAHYGMYNRMRMLPGSSTVTKRTQIIYLNEEVLYRFLKKHTSREDNQIVCNFK